MATIRIKLAGVWLLAGGLAFAAGGPTSAEEVKPAMASKASKKGAKASATKTKPKPSTVKAAPGPGRMQVDEPKTAAPMGMARESKAWQKKNAARGLTDKQKQAFRERKQKMEGMIAVIKEKRLAMRDAKPEERAALARELHNLILEKDGKDGGTSMGATARVSKESAIIEKARESEIEKKKAAEIRQKQLEARQQAFERKDPIR
ncbi:MAG: hypothetical protein M3Y08_05305 [Fibrobacterota bacterium]|nr:hypothetical protein [Fibrobacterota bacterium]